jgi:hypothetical protein
MNFSDTRATGCGTLELRLYLAGYGVREFSFTEKNYVLSWLITYVLPLGGTSLVAKIRADFLSGGLRGTP